MGDSTDGIPNSVRRKKRPPTAPPASRSFLSSRGSLVPNSSGVHLRTGPIEEGRLLKRTNSDPSLLATSAEHRERMTRYAFIRQQPEYRRLMFDMKVKKAFEEGQEKENGEGNLRFNFPTKKDKDNQSIADKRRDSTGSSISGPEFPGQHRRGKIRKGSVEVTGILRTSKPPLSPAPSTSSSVESQGRRQVRFKDDDVNVTSAASKSSRQSSTESLNSSGSATTRRTNPDLDGNDFPAKNGRRRGLNANVSMAGRTGVGQISMQMSDFHRPGHTKTMSVNYSTSVLSQNSRILSEDLIRLSGKKTEARAAFVRRTERRLRVMRKNRELREQTKAERDRRQRQEEDDGNLESAYFRRPEETILLRPSADMQEVLTIAEKKEMRTERIKERTMLLPENYRTANYIKDYGEEQAKTVGGASYLRKSIDLGSALDDESIRLLQLALEQQA